MFSSFYGNPGAVCALEGMIRQERIPQTILLSGPEGIGKATLARRFAAALLGAPEKVEADDLSLSANAAVIAEREKWPAEKRSEDPLLFASHPDFVTFPPDGPMRQISIQQIRLLRERAQFKPLKGAHRVFLIDGLDRANEQAANSLLKTLEEPPEHLVLVVTARNPYDLLPTIRSRSVSLPMSPLPADEMRAFAAEKALKDADRRLALAGGSPGVALSIDLESWDKRRKAMLALLRSASGAAPFSEWSKVADSVAAGRSDKLDTYVEVLYSLLEDTLLLHHGIADIRNVDIRADLTALSRGVDFGWLRRAVMKVDDVLEFSRRNVQKSIALDGLVAALRPAQA